MWNDGKQIWNNEHRKQLVYFLLHLPKLLSGWTMAFRSKHTNEIHTYFFILLLGVLGHTHEYLTYMAANIMVEGKNQT